MTGYFPDRAPSFEAALRDISSARPASRCAAAQVLGDVRDDALAPRARSALVHASEDLTPEVRAAAVLALAEIGGDGALPAILRCLDDGSSEVRQSAAVALGTLGDLGAVPALIDALANGAPDLRFQAATSLAEIDPNAAREPLLAALDDDDAEVLAAAALALGAIGEQRARDRIAALLAEHGPRTAFDLAYALADLGDVRATETLGGYLDDESFAWDAIVSLEKLGTSEAGRIAAQPLLAELLERPKANPAIRVKAAAALLRLGPSPHQRDRARRALVDGLRARKLEHRALAVDLLGEVGGPWAREPLERLRERWFSRALRDEIGEALGRLSDDETSP